MRAKKHLGQHFLKNEGIIARILAALEAQPDDRFLEIGPGPGALTQPFNQRGFACTAVETDADMVAHLSAQNWYPSLNLIHGDFMDLDPNELIQPGTKVFSNLPYNASVPITARLLTVARRIPLMVMMYQKEVAERIRAPSGTKQYGPISVLAQAFYDFDLHFDVQPGAFRPRPKVVSQVLRFRLKARPWLTEADLPDMTALVRHVFGQRRKMLGSLLKRGAPHWTDGVRLLESLIARGYDPKSRPEQLSPRDFADWYRATKECH